LAKKTLNVPVLAGIMLLSGYKNALFLNNEVPGIAIPDEIIGQLKDKNIKEASAVCLAYAQGIIAQLGAVCDGYYIMVPNKRIGAAMALIRYIKGEKT
jgi:homocysteine S-methyltransferase